MRETNQHLFELGFTSGSVHYFWLVKFEILIHEVIVFLKIHIFYFIFVINSALSTIKMTCMMTKFRIFTNDFYYAIAPCRSLTSVESNLEKWKKNYALK